MKKIQTLFALAALIALGIAATTPPRNTSFKNLKVLPQDISEKQLDSLMDSYNKALNVSCDFCHSKEKDLSFVNATSDRLDFAADNQMKEEARRMIRLTIDINKNYFKFDTTGRADHLLNVITCNTCHRGNPFPAHE